MKKALVCGAGGFIGHHLVNRLKKDGYFVRGVDIKKPEFCETNADEFLVLDLRLDENCVKALTLNEGEFNEVYQLAADMGGMGFIHSAECDIMYNSAMINLNMINNAIRKFRVPKYFFSSSVCVYRDMKHGESELSEEQAYPAMPDNEYGWEKLYAERMAMTFGKHNNTQVRIARFQNCFGPLGTWIGGREKAPAAMCRKIAEINGVEGVIQIWGDGTAVRSYTFVDDLVDGIRRLMDSNITTPVNIGRPEYVSVIDLVNTVAKIANKKITIENIEGPVGVESRNFSNEKIYSTGWKSNFSLKQGLEQTYPWIEEQVRKARSESN
ncbi:MAG: NAD-dependent epimerase/dehydratase family protein [Candidatus ainarchaeum sp.]|nr:NAD-dependent epimerase/dehydratase family protein [Candidatus ainarchaeum sp.]